MTAFMTTLKLFYGFITEELFWFSNQIASNIRRGYLCLRLFFSAKRDQTSPGGETPLIICAVAAAPPVGGFDTRRSIFLKRFQREWRHLRSSEFIVRRSGELRWSVAAAPPVTWGGFCMLKLHFGVQGPEVGLLSALDSLQLPSSPPPEFLVI